MVDDPPTEAEEAFQALMRDPRRYSLWARKVRDRWMASPEGRMAVEAMRKSPPKVRTRVEVTE